MSKSAPRPDPYREELWLPCVGPGWHELVRGLLNKARHLHANVGQVKEKFGGLRFYADVPENKQDTVEAEAFYKAIEEAELKSVTVCEDCGAPGEVRSLGWLRCLCDEHYQEALREERRRFDPEAT